MSDDIDTRIRQRLTQAERFLVTAHIRPDGDAIGSVIGMGLALLQAGKKVQMVLSDGIPASFKYLPGSEKIVKQPVEDFEVSIVLDCSDIQRSGQALNNRTPDINIDHHITNYGFADINLIDPKAASTTSILASHFPSWGLEITQEIADVLLTGLLTDTIGFRTSNVTSETLTLAASLMQKCTNMSELYEKALTRRSFEAARYWGQGLKSIQRDGRLVWTTLTLDDRKAASYNGNDDADLINILSGIDDSDITVIFIEQNNHHVKVSWRARPGWDVSQLALNFGGGGHPAAAGADISGDLITVKENVLKETSNFLKINNGNDSSEINQANHNPPV